MALAILYQGQPEGKTHTQGCEVRRREGTRVPARNGGALVCCSWLTPAVDLLLGEITKALIISATLECWWLGHADLCILNKMPFFHSDPRPAASAGSQPLLQAVCVHTEV